MSDRRIVGMQVFGSVEQMKAARASLGSPAALNEALVATGIDALFALLDGAVIEMDGRRVKLVDVDALSDDTEGET